MTRKQKRLAGIGVIGAVLGLAVMLASFALQDEIVFFFDPTDVVAEQKVKPGDRFRRGGLVADGSVRKADTLVHFTVTDGSNSLNVQYDGILPDLFDEGQGAVASGELNSAGVLQASEVLAKHDENYMPPEVAEALEQSGYDHKGVAQKQKNAYEQGAGK